VNKRNTYSEMGKWLYIVAGMLVVVLMCQSCENLQRKYIQQDKRFRIAYIEDTRGEDLSLVSGDLLGDSDPEIRALAAYAIARIGDAIYRPGLKAELYDTSQIAAEAKFFAAGLAGDSTFVDTLIAFAAGSGPARNVALEAVGRLGDSLVADRIAVFLDDPDSLVVYETMLAMWRADSWSQAQRMADLGKSSDNRKIVYGALYALSRGRRSEGRELFRSEMADTDPEYRMLAYSGLGRIADTASLDLIATGLNDNDGRVVASAMYALRAFGDKGSPYIARKIPELTDEKLVTLAIEIIGENGYKKAATAVDRVFQADDRENVRAAGAKTLLQLNGVEALSLIDRILTDPTEYQKTRIAEGLTDIDSAAALARLLPLFNDRSPSVRANALDGLCRVDSLHAPKYIATALADSDFVVASVAVDLAAQNNLTGLIPEIASLYLDNREQLEDDLKRTIIDACATFKKQDNYDSQNDSTLIAVLREGSNDEWFVIRRQAADELFELFNIDIRSEIGGARTKVEKRNYRDLFEKYTENPTATISTPRGDIVIELLYHAAPKTVDNFISLAGSHFYDNLIFHRVVPNFVIQDGCPRSDGWGGPGYAIRCEYNRLSYTTGMVGMALSGKDTGGSQYFITLSPQPHLDAHYTIFGRVIAGMDIAQQIVRGDSIKSITISTGDKKHE